MKEREKTMHNADCKMQNGRTNSLTEFEIARKSHPLEGESALALGGVVASAYALVFHPYLCRRWRHARLA